MDPFTPTPIQDVLEFALGLIAFVALWASVALQGADEVDLTAPPPDRAELLERDRCRS